MRFFLTLLLLLPFGLNAATTFTEFYCDSTVGTNINSGSTTNAAATYTSVNGNFNGTDTFTPTDGSTPASTVSAGDWAAIYIDGATNLVQSGSGGYIVRVLSVAAGVNGAITVSTTAFAGTAPSSSATGRSIKVGGAWNGPYGTIGFPFGFLANTATNGPLASTRCNFKNTQTNNITASITHSLAGPVLFAGMTIVPGDGGMATIDGGATGTSFVLINLSGANIDISDFVFYRNGNSGSASALVSNTGQRNSFRRCSFRNGYRAGFVTTQATHVEECEAFNCNLSNNSANQAGFILATGYAIRCLSHGNSTTATHGFAAANQGTVFIDCIAYSNGASGFFSTGAQLFLYRCDSFNNSTNGVDLTVATTSLLVAENCNFIKNGVNGINSSASIRNGHIINCGFGSGTMTNSAGGISINASTIQEIGSILYASNQTPWNDPLNGDFRIALAAAKSAGRGLFIQSTVNAPTNTVAFPDIGAAQSASTNAAAAGGTTAHTFAQ